METANAVGSLNPTEFNTSFTWYEKQVYVDPGLRDSLFDTDGEHNYCRNPDGKSTIWCHTKTGPNYWEYCLPKKLPEILTEEFTFTIIC